MCYCSDSHLELPLTSLLRLIVRIGYFTIVTQTISLPRLQKVSSNSRHAGRKLFRNDWTLIMAHNRNFIICSITIHLYLSRPLNAEYRILHWAPTRIVRLQIYINHTRTSFILITLDKISLLFFCLSISQRARKSTKLIILYHYSPSISSFSDILSPLFLFGIIFVSPVFFFLFFFALPRVLAVIRLLFLYTFLSASFSSFFSPLLNIFFQYSYTPVLFFIYILF